MSIQDRSQGNIEEFESLLLNIKRSGIDQLLHYIRNSDFYSAPASTRFHSCHAGGLLEHHLNVYNRLKDKMNDVIWKDTFERVGEDGIALAALTHDICKTNFYSVEMRNKKNENGEWIQVPFYTIDDKIPYGHGEKSVMITEQFIKLKPEERYAIRWHMGWSEPKEMYNAVGAAMRKYPLVLALHEADQEATYLNESEC